MRAIFSSETLLNTCRTVLCHSSEHHSTLMTVPFRGPGIQVSRQESNTLSDVICWQQANVGNVLQFLRSAEMEDGVTYGDSHYILRVAWCASSFTEFCSILLQSRKENVPEVMWEYRWPESSVGIATRYGLNGPTIESRWGRNFPQLSTKALGPTQLPVRWVTDLIPWGKEASEWR
jgi:hypothetical protein